ncbi:MAG: DUF1571 domain-containing protein [Planctomycetota bacterium]|nr:DUF1571 domain-containing protein [Planctomycetaceae bacterium]MDQ3329246.1 DUF1571 domain-containing protein [Planctomycetota bacterium]
MARMIRSGIASASMLLLTTVAFGQTDEAAGAGGAAEHPLKAAIKLAEQSRDAAKELKDYRALFTKREMVKGRMYASQMQMKFRSEPMSVYLRFVNPEHAGREVLYVEGRNNGQMLAHDTGLKAIVGTVALDPNGEMALAEARYPVTRIGLANLAQGIALQWEKEAAYGESDVKYYPDAKFGEQPVLVVESTHPIRRNQFRSAITRLWLDKETRLPVRVQQYDFPTAPGGKPVLVEDYSYTNVEPNVELTENDFDTRNPSYQF